MAEPDRQPDSEDMEWQCVRSTEEGTGPAGGSGKPPRRRGHLDRPLSSEKASARGRVEGGEVGRASRQRTVRVKARGKRAGVTLEAR